MGGVIVNKDVRIKGVDSIGRIGIPKEFLDRLPLPENRRIEMIVRERVIVLRLSAHPNKYIDLLGRLVIPKDFRERNGITEKIYLWVNYKSGIITMNKFTPTCVFTGESENLVQFKGKYIAKNVLTELLCKYRNERK